MVRKSVSFFQRRAAAPFALGVALCAAHPAAAASLSFNSTPVTDAVAQIDSKLGVTISLKQGIDPNSLVTFSVNDTQGSGARLDAINQLANALNADFQKVIVVRKSSVSNTGPSPTMDSDAPVNFKAGSMSVRDAIETVAGVDGGVAKIADGVDGSVKFTGDEATVKDAAAEIARQSHTIWKTFYAIVPRNRGGVPAGGKIIGYTGAGKPIVELPLRTFRVSPEPPVVDTTTAVAADGTTPDPNQQNINPPQGQMNQNAYNPYLGYYGGNYSPYNSNGMGYSNGGYGNNGYNNGNSGLTVLPGWPGYGFGAPTVITNGYGYPYR